METSACVTCKIARKRCELGYNEQGECVRCAGLKVPCIWKDDALDWVKNPDDPKYKEFKSRMSLWTRSRLYRGDNTPPCYCHLVTRNCPAHLSVRTNAMAPPAMFALDHHLSPTSSTSLIPTFSGATDTSYTSVGQRAQHQINRYPPSNRESNYTDHPLDLNGPSVSHASSFSNISNSNLTDGSYARYPDHFRISAGLSSTPSLALDMTSSESTDVSDLSINVSTSREQVYFSPLQRANSYNDEQDTAEHFKWFHNLTEYT